MGKYGSGITSGQAAMMEKDEIKHALNGEVIIGESEEGFIWGKCINKHELDRIIISAYDALYFQFKQALDSSRAMETVLEKVMEDHGIKFDMNAIMPLYMAAMEKERLQYNDYVYEEDEKDEHQ